MFFSKKIFYLLLIGILLAAVWFSYFAWVYGKGFSPVQPQLFSHKLHSDQSCISCHYIAYHSDQAGIPSVNDCMSCHIALKTESDSLKFLNENFDNETDFFYEKVCRLPDFVKFSHSKHIKASVDCAECHGDIAAMEKTLNPKILSMSFCLNCHESGAYKTASQKSGIRPFVDSNKIEIKASVQCSACHY